MFFVRFSQKLALNNISSISQKFFDNFIVAILDTMKLLLTNCSFDTENIRTLDFCAGLGLFGPYIKTAVRVFCRMDLTIA